MTGKKAELDTGADAARGATAGTAAHGATSHNTAERQARRDPTAHQAPTAEPSGGTIHEKGETLTTNTGVAIADDQNSLHAGARGPTLLEDFILREKITHFDHERIPERVVHARGSAAHGYFELTDSLAEFTRAGVLTEVGKRTPVFTRFSTVAGSRGSPDLARDVRGFAVKFYTDEGNWDLVGNNIPVFFIQDAIKFPDMVHAAKPEPDRGFPQAQTAHDTFWDFISLTPESMHMIMWIMSDRTIPRSFRMMEGFGVHTFRLVTAEGKSTFVKFHWRPRLGTQSVVWDEAVKINGADPDYHRRDLWNAIDAGDYPVYDLAVQLFDQAFADRFEFDVLDATKIIPEEQVPLRVIGHMVLDRNPDNFFAETEQVAFCTSHVVPGIDFSDDPLLQGRNFSYLDTQLKRLGGPNFQQIPINRPRCPMRNFQRDGHMQMMVPRGRVNYQPNTLALDTPKEAPEAGYRSFPEPVEGVKIRARSETFADHFSQARQFLLSQTPIEQDHIVNALVFELSKVETKPVRARMVSQLLNIDTELGRRVAEGLALDEDVTAAPALRPTRQDLPTSPALSILAKAKPTLHGRLLGVLITNGVSGASVRALQAAAKAEGAMVKLVAPRVGGVRTAEGAMLEADFQLSGGPSVLFDAVALLLAEDALPTLSRDTTALAWVQMAYSHMKVIGHTEAALPLLQTAGVQPDPGIVALSDGGAAFLSAAAKGRIWQREAAVHLVH